MMRNYCPIHWKRRYFTFLRIQNKHTILLALTSNPSAKDFQYSKENDLLLFEKILKLSQEWDNSENLMYVVGATKSESLKSIRSSYLIHFS